MIRGIEMVLAQHLFTSVEYSNDPHQDPRVSLISPAEIDMEK